MKYFPKNAKTPTTKTIKQSRAVSRTDEKIQIKKTFSLKEEFDLLIKRKYSSISNVEKQRIWNTIGTKILEDNTTINSLTISHLDKLIKNNL